MGKIDKAIFAVIAAALCTIAFKLYTTGSAPTVGDFVALGNIKDTEQREKAQKRLINNLPFVRVQGG